MRTDRVKRIGIVVRGTGLLCTLWLGLLGKSFAQLGVPTDESQLIRLIYQTRQIGRCKDRAQIDTLLVRLQNEYYEKTTAQAIRLRMMVGLPWSAHWSTHLYAATFVALGRLGDSRAIPAIEAFVQEPTRQHLKPFAVVAVARIKAENAVPYPKTAVEWERKVQVFSQALGVSLREMKEVLKSETIYAYLQLPSISRLALRALAEMAVEARRGGVREAIEWCEASGVAWQDDVAASLTVRLAFLGEEERIRWLLGYLQSRNVFTPADSYFEQALADCGERAVMPIGKWIEHVLQEQSLEDRNIPYTRSDRLLKCGFWLLAAIGTRESQALLTGRLESEVRTGQVAYSRSYGYHPDGSKTIIFRRISSGSLSYEPSHSFPFQSFQSICSPNN